MRTANEVTLTLLVQIASEWEQYVLGLGAYRCQNHGSPLRITIDFQVWLLASSAATRLGNQILVAA